MFTQCGAVTDGGRGVGGSSRRKKRRTAVQHKRQEGTTSARAGHDSGQKKAVFGGLKRRRALKERFKGVFGVFWDGSGGKTVAKSGL